MDKDSVAPLASNMGIPFDVAEEYEDQLYKLIKDAEFKVLHSVWMEIRQHMLENNDIGSLSLWGEDGNLVMRACLDIVGRRIKRSMSNTALHLPSGGS